MTGRAAATKHGYHHGDLRAALLAAAADDLRHGGIEALSLRYLARRCGVSRTAPYRHFANKDALLAALATEAFTDFNAHLRAGAARAGAPLARLQAMGRAYVEFATGEPHRLRLMFGSEAVAKTQSAELAAAAAEGFGILSAAVADVLATAAPADVDARTATIGAWALVHGLATLHIDLPPGLFDGSEEAFLDRVHGAMAIYGRGLLAPPA